jgi:hypothetical protein
VPSRALHARNSSIAIAAFQAACKVYQAHHKAEQLFTCTNLPGMACNGTQVLSGAAEYLTGQPHADLAVAGGCAHACWQRWGASVMQCGQRTCSCRAV